MNPRTRNLIFTLLTLLVFGISLTRPLSVRADEGTPTEAPAPTQDTSASPGDAAALAAPAPTDLAADPPTAEPSEAPSPTQDVSASATEAPVPTDPVATDVPTAQATSLPELLDQVPQATAIVVLDQAGNPEPLATQQAADVINTGDPSFTVSGIAYSFTSLDCDPFAGGLQICANPIQAAIDCLSGAACSSSPWFGTGTAPDDGNVYVEAGTYANSVTVNGTTWTSTPGYFGLVGAGSGATTLDGYISIMNMNDFTLQGFYIFDSNGTTNPTYVSADSNNGTLTISDVTVTNGYASGNLGDGIQLNHQNGDIHLANVNSSNNYGHGAYIDNRAGAGHNVTVDASNFNSEQNGFGLLLVSAGDVTLANVSVNGAYIDNSAGSGHNVTVDTGTFYAYGDGLDIFSAGSVSLSNVSTGHTHGYGARIDNTAGIGSSVTVDNSTFNGNFFDGSDGLYILSAGNVSLSDVIAAINQGGNGAYIDNRVGSDHSVTVDSSKFGGNWHNGLYILSAGDVSLSNMSSGANLGYGAYIDNTAGTGHDVTVDPGTFIRNRSDGLHILSAGDVSLIDVDASENRGAGAFVSNSGNLFIDPSTFNSNLLDGLRFSSAGDNTIDCSDFSNNGGYGINGNTAGTLTTNGDSFAGNSAGDVYVTGGTWLDNAGFDCGGAGNGGGGGGNNDGGGRSGGDGGSDHQPDTTSGPSSLFNIIPVTGSGLADLDCSGVLGVALQLSDGDRVTLYCPVGGQGSASTTPADQLPAAVSQGTLVSALTFNVVGEGGISEQTLGSGAAVSFVLPEDGLDNEYAIFYWDTAAADGTGAWVELHNGPLHDPSDAKFVTDAGSKTTDGNFEARVNFTGTFALVNK